MNKNLKMFLTGILVLGLCALSVYIYVQMNQPDYSNVPHPEVTITMKNGDVIRMELYPNVAPNTVANFVYLAQQGYYDGIIFHRVVPGFMIQGGDPTGTGRGGPGYTIKGEFSANGVKNDLKHERGVVSMARTMQSNDTAGSQFFIMHQNASHLDGQYAAFGRVTDEASMKVVDKIATTKTDAYDKPLTEWRIDTVKVETHGITYEPVRIEQ